ncbi:hypothetical protein B0H15DRAFT_803564 [Mycena belliarum]|uniref:Uncharacterized protein n=1 Tax=Mycena belliarum TaxID=1033014 RepID=A0AAD6TVV9_9AGAR|nr:hypothetical protein B0H15DRAFT_803564 [Mycena belliae]
MPAAAPRALAVEFDHRRATSAFPALSPESGPGFLLFINHDDDLAQRPFEGPSNNVGIQLDVNSQFIEFGSRIEAPSHKLVGVLPAPLLARSLDPNLDFLAKGLELLQLTCPFALKTSLLCSNGFNWQATSFSRDAAAMLTAIQLKVQLDPKRPILCLFCSVGRFQDLTTMLDQLIGAHSRTPLLYYTSHTSTDLSGRTQDPLLYLTLDYRRAVYSSLWANYWPSFFGLTSTQYKGEAMPAYTKYPEIPRLWHFAPRYYWFTLSG